MSNLDDFNENLINIEEKESFENPTFIKSSIKAKIASFCGFKSKNRYKIVRFPKQTFPYSNTSNRVDNRKTNIFTFIPKLLINEFKQFLNLYFLILCFSQFIPALQVGKLNFESFNLRLPDQLHHPFSSHSDYSLFRRDSRRNQQIQKRQETQLGKIFDI